jgi:hypothetical protein
MERGMRACLLVPELLPEALSTSFALAIQKQIPGLPHYDKPAKSSVYRAWVSLRASLIGASV